MREIKRCDEIKIWMTVSTGKSIPWYSLVTQYFKWESSRRVQ